MDSISELTQLVQPPDKPVDSKGDWKDVETRFGVEFPGDYKEFVRHYGSGIFCSIFHIYTPFTPHEGHVLRNLMRWYESRIEYAEIEIPYDIHPVKPGLFPIATSCEDIPDGVIAWYTSGETSSWPIVYAHRHHECLLFEQTGFLDFLLLTAIGKCPLPQDWIELDDFHAQPPAFIPDKPINGSSNAH